MSETHKHSQTLPLPPAERGALDATASLPGGTGAEELALHAQVNGRKCETALVIMARYPEQGKGKTRLAHHLGDEATLSLYRAFLSDLAQRFAGWIYDLHWAYTPAEADFSGYAEALVPTRTAYMHSFSQRGPDLGARLHHAFRTTYARQFQRTVLIGSDAPQISRATIVQAEAALDTADVVLGPADDGGYYLIAMRQPHDVFTDVPMSTSIVLQMTIEKARQRGLTVHLLEPLFDVDELADLERLAALLQAEHALAPATAACLAQILPYIHMTAKP